LRPWGRRTFLAVTLGGLSSLVWGGTAWRAVSGALGSAADAIPQSLRDLVPTGGWRIYTVADTMPSFDPRTWRLRVDGLVRRPQTLTYGELQALPRTREVADFHCVTGWSVGHVHWAGIGFPELLAATEPLPEARAVVFWSAEHPYVDSLTLEQAMSDAMLATEMDGKPLPRPHGAPARVVIPAMYGYKSVKWVERIELVARQPRGYWEQRGYDQDAWVGKSNGRNGFF
jgi:DMSO/TMAO reductase YedYZ molybdopterin-dependent catalytic subunit